MKTFIIAGGNSGIGQQVARNLLDGGDRVIVLGRDQRKGAAALASFAAARERAEFISADISNRDAIREAADRIAGSADQIDGILHSTGVIYDGDVRTADGIPMFLAVSFLGRYHLTQLLMPQLLAAPSPRVLMMGARMKQVPPVDPDEFPRFPGSSFRQLIPQVNGAVMHYAAHLAATHQEVFAGVLCPGLVRTGIFRNASWPTRAMVAAAAPFVANSIQTAAANPTQALLTGSGAATYWPRAKDYNTQRPIVTDRTLTDRLMAASRQATGV